MEEYEIELANDTLLIKPQLNKTFDIYMNSKKLGNISPKYKDGIIDWVPDGSIDKDYAQQIGEVIFEKDEYPNRKTDLDKLASLKPAFKKDGVVTAGTASGLNDGASITLIASEEMVKKYNLKPLAEVLAIGQGGVEPNVMGLGPTPAIRQAVKQGHLKLNDIDVFELNEAFAAQSLGVIHELSAEHHVSEEEILSKTNPNGGAIALGHPVGASGNRIIVTLVHELIALDKNIGCASLCIGGGMGTAVIIKKV